MQSEPRSLKCSIPWMMAGGRAVLGPVMVVGEHAGWSGLALAMLVVTGLFSDIFDGVVARRWKCDTAAVRLCDSLADIVFYVGCGAALWMQSPQLVRRFSLQIAAMLALETLCIGFALVKFGRPPSYHSYLAKIWGLTLAAAIVLSFTALDTTAADVAWWVCSALGALACLEGIAISLIMPEWRHDLKSFARALGIRRRILLERRRVADRNLRRAAAAVLAILLALVTIPSGAASIPSVKYIGGTAPELTTGTQGALDTSSDQLTFQWGGSLAIRYGQIQNFSYRDEPAVHLGILPLIAVTLIRPQIYRHIVSITYVDPSGQKQVAIFEVPKKARATLPVVLQERTGICSDQYQLPCRATAPRDSHRVIAQERYAH